MLGPNEYTLVQFREEFPDHEACLGYLWRTRHAAADGEHAECPHCQTVRRFKRYRTAQRRHSWTCTACGRHLQPTAGTIFHKSSTPLDRWFSAIYLITATDGKISAKQLERELGVTYKTAWRMSGLIRGRIAVPVRGDPAADPVEHGRRSHAGAAPRSRTRRCRYRCSGRRIRRQMARVAHEQRIARHHASDIYSQGIASIRQKNHD